MNRIEAFLSRQQPSVGLGETEWTSFCTTQKWKLRPSLPDPFEVIRQFVELDTRRRGEATVLRKRVEDLARKVEKHEKLLTELFGRNREIQFGHFELWCSSEEAQSYRGKHVMFDEDKGLVASADSLDELMKKFGDKLGKGVVVGFVPEF
jgi:hypothetical protein